MSKQKKESNELDNILEQLKQSFENDKSIEDDVNSEGIEEDEELKNILSRLFPDGNDDTYNSADFSDAFTESDNPVYNEESEEYETEEASEKSLIETEIKDEEEVLCPLIEDELKLDEMVENKPDDASRVDDVFNIMFSHKTESNTSSVDNHSILGEISNEDEMISDDMIAIEEEANFVETPTLDNNMNFEEASTVESEAAFEKEPIIVEDNVAEETTEEISDTETIAEPTSVSENVITSEDTRIEEIAIEEAAIDEPEPPKIVLSKDEYTLDELQLGLPGFKSSRKISAVAESSSSSSVSEPETGNTFDNNDISLLFKLGYGNEIKSKVGAEKAQNVLFEEDNSYVPDKTQKVFGFCNHELSDRKDLKNIQKKYNINKIFSIAFLAAICLLALILFANTVYFDFVANKIENYPLVLTVDFVSVLLIGVILSPNLYRGWVGIIRFEANRYTILSYAFSIYFLYDLISYLVFISNRPSITSKDLVLIGFAVSLFAIASMGSDTLNCFREAANLDIIASGEEIYTAEPRKSFSDNKTSTHKSDRHAFKIRKTKLINAYFRKSAQYKSELNLLVLLGIIPTFSLILGCIVGFSCNSFLNGATTVFLTVLLSAPISLIFAAPFFEFIVSRIFKDKGIAFIGSAAEEHAVADVIIFSDYEAVEVIKYTDITPAGSKNTEVSNSLMRVAHEIFKLLGGSLSEIIPDTFINTLNEKRELVINSITENGIDIYYASAVNILLGDVNYLQSKGISVKTATNLSTATKGADKSVIYMVFDGVPKLGFIITGKVKQSFSALADKLKKHNIETYVESYEPQINNTFFDKNKNGSEQIKVTKPTDFESASICDMCEGSIVSAKDSVNLISAICECPVIVKENRKNFIFNRLISALGILLSVILAVIACLPNKSAFLSWINSHTSTLTVLFMLLGLIPSITAALLYRKRKIGENYPQSEKKQ